MTYILCRGAFILKRCSTNHETRKNHRKENGHPVIIVINTLPQAPFLPKGYEHIMKHMRISFWIMKIYINNVIYTMPQAPFSQRNNEHVMKVMPILDFFQTSNPGEFRLIPRPITKTTDYKNE